jgi:hypothetical protein
MSKQKDKITVVSQNLKRNMQMVIVHPAEGGTITRHERIPNGLPPNPKPVLRSKRELANLPGNYRVR